MSKYIRKTSAEDDRPAASLWSVEEQPVQRHLWDETRDLGLRIDRGDHAGPQIWSRRKGETKHYCEVPLGSPLPWGGRVPHLLGWWVWVFLFQLTCCWPFSMTFLEQNVRFFAYPEGFPMEVALVFSGQSLATRSQHKNKE